MSTIITAPPQSSAKASHSPVTTENLQVNGNHTTDWLHDPLAAMARQRGPYTIDNAERHLHEETVELYNGWLVWQQPTDFKESTVVGTIQSMFDFSARKIGFGQAVPDQLECLLSDGTVIKPDACLLSWQRSKDDVAPQGPNNRPILSGAPELVVEARSPSNWRKQEAMKRAQYFANGTQIIWDVDEQNETIYVYRKGSPASPQIFTRDDEIDCEPLLPEWRRRVADIFADELSAEAVAGEVADAWKEEGREEGIEQRNREIAYVLYTQGQSLAMISDVISVSEETLQVWFAARAA